MVVKLPLAVSQAGRTASLKGGKNRRDDDVLLLDDFFSCANGSGCVSRMLRDDLPR